MRIIFERFAIAAFLLGGVPAQADQGGQPAPSLRIEAATGSDMDFHPGAVRARSGSRIRLKVKGDAGLSVRWIQIVPETARYYKNANHPWEVDPYKWVGYGQIEYRAAEIEGWRGRTEVEVNAPFCFSAASHSPYYHADLGSFWLQVQDENGRRSPGLPEVTERGLPPQVFRLTLETDEGYLGSLTGFFNVPGLFGCTAYQSYHYIGVDCADVLVAAHQRLLGLGQSEDINVTWLVDHWKVIAALQILEGVPKTQLKWGSEIQPGDAIAVRYTPGKAFMHIGALYADANHDGLLDSVDAVLHAGPQALHISKLREKGFDGEVVILRAPSK